MTDDTFDVPPAEAFPLEQFWSVDEPERISDLDRLHAAEATIERYREAMLRLHRCAGPYQITQWTEDVNHADPCDCDLDEEEVGDDCMANSEWTYAVVVDGGAFAPRLILLLPRQVPAQPEHDGPPLVAFSTGDR